MSSHSRTKGKARKSTASSAKSSATVSSKPSAPRKVEDEDFHVTRTQIETITASAIQEFRRQTGKPLTPATDHRTHVDELLRNIHASVAADAPESEQAEQFLLGSIITALRPFWDGEA